MRDWFLAPRVFKKDPTEHRDEFVAASPLARVRADAPDFFVLHGSNATLVDVQQARAFVAALREVSKRTVTYHELRGTQHAFAVFSSIRSQRTIRAGQRWLAWHHQQWQQRRLATRQLVLPPLPAPPELPEASAWCSAGARVVSKAGSPLPYNAITWRRTGNELLAAAWV